MQEAMIIQEIERISGGDSQAKKDLIEIFIRQTSELIAQLQVCLLNTDWKEIKKIAHTLKSSFLYIGINQATLLADGIEKKAGTNVEITAQQVQELTTICFQLINELQVSQ
jgi:HPt (histidine-containing phosphotransfer) domain-containing protein